MIPSALLGPLLTLASEQTPAPSPSPAEHTIYNVSPGISGFIAFFVLALIGWLLFRSLVKHMRKVDQEKIRRERQAEEDGGGPDAGTAGSGAAADEPGDVPGR